MWFLPDAYLQKVQFQILSIPDLNLAPTSQVVTLLSHDGGGVQQAVLLNPGETRFFKLMLQIRF